MAVDDDSRERVRAGQFDIMIRRTPTRSAQFLDDDAFEINSTSLLRRDAATSMLNVAEGRRPTPRARTPPARCSTSTAAGRWPTAIDIERLSEERGAGLAPPANGPFPPGSLGYLEDTGYPTFDPDKANEEMDTCLAELGTRQHRVHVQHDERPVQRRDEHADHLDVDRRRSVTRCRPRSRRSSRASTSASRSPARSRRSAGATTAASIPTSSGCGGRASASAPIGTLALNFGRFKDAEIDAALNDDQDDRRPGRPQGGRRGRSTSSFGEQVYNLWLDVGAVGDHHPAVRQRRRGQHAARRRRRASASPAPAVTSIEPDLVRRTGSASDPR